MGLCRPTPAPHKPRIVSLRLALVSPAARMASVSFPPLLSSHLFFFPRPCGLWLQPSTVWGTLGMLGMRGMPGMRGMLGMWGMQELQGMLGMQAMWGTQELQGTRGLLGMQGMPAAGAYAGGAFWGVSQGSPRPLSAPRAAAPHPCRTFCRDLAALGMAPRPINRDLFWMAAPVGSGIYICVSNQVWWPIC